MTIPSNIARRRPIISDNHPIKNTPNAFPQISETIYTPSLPDISKALHVSNNEVQLTLSVYFAGFALGDFLSIHISTGVLFSLFNIPVVILAWKKVGKAFTFFSFLCVIFMTLFLEVIPVRAVSNDIILNAIFGGIISAIGV